MITDPIADMLTRIRNAGAAGHATVSMPASKLKLELARVMHEEGYIDGVERIDGLGFGNMRVRLRYHHGEHVMTGIERASRPGQRRYVKSGEMPKILNGYGIAIVTTSKGVMTGHKAETEGVGGEVLCTIW